MVELRVTIESPEETMQYSVLAPIAIARASQCVASAMEVGFALLGAYYRKVPDGNSRVGSKSV